MGGPGVVRLAAQRHGGVGFACFDSAFVEAMLGLNGGKLRLTVYMDAGCIVFKACYARR